MATYTSAALRDGAKNLESFTAGGTYTFSFFNKSSVFPNNGYFTLVASGSSTDFNNEFDPTTMANVAGEFLLFDEPFITDYVWNRDGEYVVSGSGLIQSDDKWSIVIPNGPIINKGFKYKPTNNIGIGALTYFTTAHTDLKIV